MISAPERTGRAPMVNAGGLAGIGGMQVHLLVIGLIRDFASESVQTRRWRHRFCVGRRQATEVRHVIIREPTHRLEAMIERSRDGRLAGDHRTRAGVIFRRGPPSANHAETDCAQPSRMTRAQRDDPYRLPSGTPRATHGARRGSGRGMPQRKASARSMWIAGERCQIWKIIWDGAKALLATLRGNEGAVLPRTQHVPPRPKW